MVVVSLEMLRVAFRALMYLVVVARSGENERKWRVVDRTG